YERQSRLSRQAPADNREAMVDRRSPALRKHVRVATSQATASQPQPVPTTRAAAAVAPKRRLD
ncbi:MAG TPA: hypothetical protein VFP29_09625, partial [Methyloceanibacter sp.]|nr:hypothetical protein [Methyloceanibacter sp.]